MVGSSVGGNVSSNETGNGRACLLIVDDEMLNRELLRRVLQREYEIEEAEDSAHAIQVLEQRNDIALVLCDQLMPGGSGTELAEKVRTRWPDTRFLLLTGYDDDDEVRKALDTGLVRKVISKPWRSKALKTVIEQELAG
jgi:response regulator RpfG family c-di-GMP phosphodiesterase